MNDRLFLAAHAPKEIPDDFQPVMRAKPMVPFPAAIADPEVREDVQNALFAASDPATEGGRKWMDEWAKACEEVNRWNADRIRQRRFQWPIAWADGVIAAEAESAFQPR